MKGERPKGQKEKTQKEEGNVSSLLETRESTLLFHMVLKDQLGQTLGSFTRQRQGCSCGHACVAVMLWEPSDL